MSGCLAEHSVISHCSMPHISDLLPFYSLAPSSSSCICSEDFFFPFFFSNFMLERALDLDSCIDLPLCSDRLQASSWLLCLSHIVQASLSSQRDSFFGLHAGLFWICSKFQCTEFVSSFVVWNSLSQNWQAGIVLLFLSLGDPLLREDPILHLFHGNATLLMTECLLIYGYAKRTGV